jgi:FMN phosphatase YigB (HAD superfamily)
VIRAILFDLDDTLLGSSNDDFLPPYFEALARKMAHLIPPERFLPQLIRSTQRAIADTDPNRTNLEVFWEDFLDAVGGDPVELKALLDDFYAHDFPALRRYTQTLPEARRVVQTAFDCGFIVVIATNPLYPRQAIEQRLAWAGIADFPYALVTTAENMHACKPQLAYYREIAERIAQPPQACLMVGDDLANDIRPAAAVGMRTFWITTEPMEDGPADWQGTLLDVERLIRGVGGG